VRKLSFSDYIVFADESGDHGMESINPEFPVFSLVFCVFEKNHYADVIEPAFRRFKFKWFGHDNVILHEREIRKQQPPFDFLKGSPTRRQEFFDDLNGVIDACQVTWFASIIDKLRHRAKYTNPWNPYEIAMHFGLERLCQHLRAKGEEGKTVHVLIESRGRNEDRDLELEFRRVVSNQSQWGWRRIDFSKIQFEPLFVAKQANLAGHQFSDMIARPLALKALRPDQTNRASEAIWNRIGAFKVFP
jgi:hypothetical protein